MMNIDNPVCAVLDTTDLEYACALAGALRGAAGLVKIGMEFFYANGRPGYEAVAACGLPVFLDLKLHDIPNTMVQALRGLMRLSPRPVITNIHSSAGPEAMRACAEVIGNLDGAGRPKLVAVTVLTSLDDDDLAAIGFDGARTALDHVVAQARLARDCGIDGVVCGPGEVAAIKSACGGSFLTVVPGIRPAGGMTHDQKRIATPQAARAAGADVLVIGRAISQSANPAAAARAVADGL